MATYKEIRGTQIEAVASDPTNPVEGQVWYNTTSNVVKGQSVTAAGSWSSGGALNTSRAVLSASGTQTVGLAFGGAPDTTATETYNGTNWTSVNSLNEARHAGAGGGTQPSTLYAGGLNEPPGPTELYNGTNWTEVNDLNTARGYLGGGIESSTAGVVFGGIGPPSGTGATELWNGTNWAEVNDLNTPRRSVASVGTSTAALCVGGYVSGDVLNVETWNGTNWAEVNDIASPVGQGGSFGTNTDAIVGSGTTVQLWNGTNWATTTSASSPTANRAGLGTQALGLLTGGEPPPTGTDVTEEWIGAGASQVRTFTDS